MRESLPDHSALGFTLETEFYHPDFIKRFKNVFNHSRVEMEMRMFDNGMPLYIVGSAEHALMVTWINGDNWQQAMIDIACLGNGLTYSGDRAGKNCKRLGIFAPFIDCRQDKRTRKPIPDSPDMAIVKNQFVFTETLAKMVREVAHAEYIATLDIHSNDAQQTFIDSGLEVLNLTAVHLFVDYLDRKKYLTSHLDTVVTTTDLGDLNRAHAMSEYMHAQLGIISKKRTASEDGTRSTTSQELLYGDLRDKRVILIDDMASGGGTIINAVELVDRAGAAEIFVCVTHPVFVKDYYMNLQSVLANEKVQLILVTNSLPTETRRNRPVSLPYIGKGAHQKSVRSMDVSEFLADAATVLLLTPDIASAKKQLGRHVLELRDPYSLYAEITGEELYKPQDVAIYTGKGNYEFF